MTAPNESPRATLRERGEHVAPWLVVLSQHMPLAREDSETGEPYVACSCGSVVYLGHLAGVLADRAADGVAAAHAAGVAQGRAEGWDEGWDARHNRDRTVVTFHDVDGNVLRPNPHRAARIADGDAP